MEPGIHIPNLATPFARIVVPLDGSEASRSALVYAAAIPCRELVLVHVSVDREVIIPEWVMRDDDEAHGDSLRDALELAAAEYRTPEREVRVDMRIGDVAGEILAAGDEADLVVMMTHGRGAAGRIIFGSIADRVVRHSASPVLLVRVGELTRYPRPPRRITIALDGSALAEQSVPGAARLATLTKLPVHLVRSVGLADVEERLRQIREQAVDPLEMSPTLYDETLAAVREEAEAYLEDHAEALRQQGLTVDIELLEGSVPFTIMWEVNPDDVLVVTSRGRGGYKRWALGSVAEKLIREAPCPVLIHRGPEDVPGQH